jgi:hypothetical protein
MPTILHGLRRESFLNLDRKMSEIASHATGHAASCAICQHEVSRILGQDWSPF